LKFQFRFCENDFSPEEFYQIVKIFHFEKFGDMQTLFRSTENFLWILFIDITIDFDVNSAIFCHYNINVTKSL